MAIELGKGIGQPIKTPEVREKKGLARRVGEFVAPTTTGLIRGLREGEAPSLKQAAGTALEVGSFLIPTAAIARGFGLLGRGAKAITAVARAKKVARAPKKTELEALQTGIKEFGARTRGQLKTGVQVGGATGFAFETGRALGEEDVSVTEAIGRGVTGGAIGAVGGAVLTPAVSIIGRTARGGVRTTSDALRRLQSTLKPQERTQAVGDLTTALSKSFVEDNPAVINKLEKIANNARRRGDTNIDETALLREVVEDGHIPKVDGEIGRFGSEILEVRGRIGGLAKGVGKLAEPITIKTPLSAIKRESKRSLEGRTDVDILKAERQLNAQFKSLQKQFGTSLSASNLNDIRVIMNRRTKAFGKEFVQDVQNAIGGATRNRLDEFTPAIRELNAESGRLQRVINTMEVLNNKKINPGFFATGAGRFIGTVGASAAGLSIAGPGGLVVAGIAANLGSRFVANIIRQGRFNPNAREIIKRGLRQDKKLLRKVLTDATPADRALIERAIGKVSTPKARARK